jgi:hypothetical protein
LRGQAIHVAASSAVALATGSPRLRNSAADRTNTTATSKRPLSDDFRITPEGRPGTLHPAGAPTRATTAPSFIPSFFAGGVPE